MSGQRWGTQPHAGGTRPSKLCILLAWSLLALSLAAHVGVTLIGSDPFKMIDLRVYLDGAGWAIDGTLYDSTSNSVSESGDPIVLPFTYPPFAALIFLPLSVLNYTVARVLWQLASLAALALIIYLSLRLVGRAGPNAVHRPKLHATLITGTALALWLEPVRTTFNYGQINLFLAALLLAGAVATRNWLGGSSVGITAGIKLVPAITGLYYLATRRWSTAIACVVSFLGTVALAAVVLPAETSRYFLHLIFDPARTGPVFGAINQSWRGALARLAGQPDVPKIWLVAVVITVVLGLWTLRRTVRAADRTAAFLSVQFLGLLVSPISWSHHWVWIVPLLIWCFYGPRRSSRAVQVLAVGWMLAAYSYLVSILVAQPDNYEVPSRPWWAAAAGTVYVVMGILTLLVLALTARPTPDVSGLGDAKSEVLDSAATRESGAPG